MSLLPQPSTVKRHQGPRKRGEGDTGLRRNDGSGNGGVVLKNINKNKLLCAYAACCAGLACARVRTAPCCAVR